MVPEREQVIEELKELGYEQFEKHIFKYCYYEAEKRNIPLDWNKLFSNWYIAQTNRIISNIKLFPEKFKSINPEDIMKYKDSDFNDKMKDFIVTVKARQRSVNTDYTCGKCKNIGVYIEKKQLRSLDEGKTSVFSCVKCHHSWKEN